MDFRELSYVLAIAKYQNITKASEALYVSQPTLSKFLKSLEEELGTPLFRRLGYKYVLTYAGECYTQKAREILQLKQDLDVEMADIIKSTCGKLKVAFPTMRSTYMLPKVLPAFQEQYPNVKIELHEGYSSDLDQMLLDGDAEIAFYSMTAEIHNPLIDYQSLGEEEMLICAPKGHPIGALAVPNPGSRYPQLDLKVLEEERMILMNPRQRTRQIIDQHLQQEDVRLHNVLETGNMSAIINLVASGYGLAFLFESHLSQFDISRIDRYSFGSTRTIAHFVAAHRKGSYLPAYALDFIELVKNVHS